MRGHGNLRLVAALSVVLGMSGCANPYALKTSTLNYTAAQTAGSIEVGDAKLYKREALINERRKEVAYINDLIDASKTQTFTPEVVRELETISSLTGALGLKFDPAGGANYRNAVATSDAQQEIKALELALKLEQLKHDAELLRASLASQTTPVNADLGKVGDITVGAPTSALSTASVDQLKTAITALQTSLATRLDTAGKSPLAATAGVSPIDAFNDRAAYRDRLTTARNAASLDELHDKDGAALVRLSFAATVLPPTKEYRDTLGVLRMTAKGPDWKEAGRVEDVYRLWIANLNRTYNIRDRTGPAPFRESPAIRGLAITGALFDTVYYFASTDGKSACDGLSFQETNSTAAASCTRLSLAAPRFISARDPAGTTLADSYAALSHPQANFATEYARVQLFMLSPPPPPPPPMPPPSATALTSTTPEPLGAAPKKDPPASAPATSVAVDPASLFDKSVCRINFESAAARAPTSDGAKLTNGGALETALVTYLMGEALSDLELQARKTLSDAEMTAESSSNLFDGLRQRIAPARQMVEALQAFAARQGCQVSAGDLLPVQIPARFREVVTNDAYRPSVYEVGPRERVQQLSTTARAADAIGLAAAISGSIPGKGIGMDGNIAYSRSATGKADALERAPLVVSFAEARGTGKDSAPAFGWLLGPKATLNPRKKALEFEHQVKPYDLSADLAVPGWWPYLDLMTETAWAPNWRETAGKVLGATAAKQTLRVRMSPNSADLTALTGLIAGDAVRLVTFNDYQPLALTPCAETQLQITGDHVWRASAVSVGGRMIGGDKIEVLPDMAGIAVTVPKEAYLGLEPSGKVTVTVLTPYGRASKSIPVRDAKDDGSCKTKEEAAAADKKPTGPTITKVNPAEISVCAVSPVFSVSGQNLKDIKKAMLNAAVGEVSLDGDKDGALLQVKFSSLQMRTSFAGLQKASLVLKTAKGESVEKDIALVVPMTCP